ncbi:FtsX-like permease family protein [Actinomadura parmotrematis]|uniref:ABC3 transporter permease C-terminal domain-containing protein n=1 Tax=Actinomadura parmotrematis TaxID=2864039 RepID=A0ABS7FRM7_9ACTN|nr:FtsX-like permease family protein [Actinomadura parmotrematis]MBW8482875.1 hypothetical protein [Actinomadura parmotrematis]
MKRPLAAERSEAMGRAQWAPVVGLAVAAFVAALAAVLVPAALEDGYDRAAVAAVRGTDVVVTGNAESRTGRTVIPDERTLDARTRVWRGALPRTLASVVGAPEAAVTTGRFGVAGEFSKPRLAQLEWSPDAARRVRFVAGGPAASRDGLPQVAMSAADAAAFGYRVGSTLEVAEEKPPLGQPPVAQRVRVSGLYAPVDARDPFWAVNGGLLKAQQVVFDREGTLADRIGLLMDAGAYRAFTAGVNHALVYSWRFPARPGEVTNDRAARLPGDVQAFRTAVAGQAGGLQVVTVLDERVAAHLAQLRTAKVLIGLVTGGLVALGAGAGLLVAGLLADRLRPSLALMRARGASLRQLAVPSAGLAALGVVPGAAAGLLVGTAVAGTLPGAAVPLVVAVAALVVALPPVLAVRANGGRPAPPRRAEDTARPSRRRLVLEALVAVLAVAAAVVARQRGAAGQAELGADPLVSAMPVLLAVAAGLVVLHVYPFPLRLLARALRRGRSAVAFLGVARAARGGLVSALPLVVLLLAAALAGFTASVRLALGEGQERAAWQKVGADAVVAADGLDLHAVDRVKRVPGVTDAIGAQVVANANLKTRASFTSGAQVTVVQVDLAAYRRLAGGAREFVPVGGAKGGALATPAALRDAGGGGGPYVLSQQDAVTVDLATVTPARGFPGQPPGDPLVIVPYGTLESSRTIAGQAPPTMVLAAGEHVDGRALRAAAAEVTPEWARATLTVRTRADAHRELAALPLIAVVHDAFRDGVVAAALCGILTVGLMLVVGARARARSVAHLQVLGFGRRGRRALAVMEVAPVLLVAAVAGWALGVLLPVIAGPLVDLRPYTAGFTVPAFAVDPVASAVLGGALLLAAAAAVAVDAAFDARDRLGAVLRTEDEG